MNFGTSSKTDYDRVAKSMLDNSLRDPEPSLMSIYGSESKVWNLRPLEPHKHISNSPGGFRFAPNSQIDRMLDMQMSRRNNSIILGDIGLPPLNLNQKHLFKTIKMIRKNNG